MTRDNRPSCDLCMTITPAVYDAKTVMGPWANVCEVHFQICAVKTKGLYTRLSDVAINNLDGKQAGER